MLKRFVFALIAACIFAGCGSEASASKSNNVSPANWKSMLRMEEVEGAKQGIRTELLVGGGFQKKPLAWEKFLDEVVTPRFPGYSVFDAAGYWKKNKLPSKVVYIVHEDTEEDNRKIEEIRSIFLKDHGHESIMRVSGPVYYKY